MKLRKRVWQLAGLPLLLMTIGVLAPRVSEAKTYRISPKSAPCDSTGSSSLYNKYTKNYWTIRSYMIRIEKEKGGTLILKKGTYKISNTLFVPSNTHIILKDGAVLKKTKKSGTSAMPASSSMFQLIRPSRAGKTAVYGKHKGEKNITFTGKGTATIDLGYVKMGSGGKSDVIGVVMGHNKNVTYDNITFKNMRYGHMIELDAGKNIKFNNCTFTGFKASGNYNKEAINLDTPDKKRNGFNANWSKKDCTPNEGVTITRCTFDNLEVAIGTHRYTGKVYQQGVVIKDCTFNKVQTAIRVLNWKKPTITENTFTNCKPTDRYPFVIFMAGVKGIDFSYNSFTNCGTPNGTRDGKQLLQFWCNAGYSANQTIYAATYSSITKAQAEKFFTNTAVKSGAIRTYNCPYSIDFSGSGSQDNSDIG